MTSGQITEPEAASIQPRPTPCWEVYLFFLKHTSKGGYKQIMLISQCLGSFGPYIVICSSQHILLKDDVSKNDHFPMIAVVLTIAEAFLSF
jgi:hypothetical protein